MAERTFSQNIDRFKGFGHPQGRARSKAKDIANKVREQGKKRISSPPPETKIDARKSKVDYLTALLDKRNEIGDPLKKKQSATQIVTYQDKLTSKKSSESKEYIVSVNTGKLPRIPDRIHPVQKTRSVAISEQEESAVKSLRSERIVV